MQRLLPEDLSIHDIRRECVCKEVITVWPSKSVGVRYMPTATHPKAFDSLPKLTTVVTLYPWEVSLGAPEIPKSEDTPISYIKKWHRTMHTIGPLHTWISNHRSKTFGRIHGCETQRYRETTVYLLKKVCVWVGPRHSNLCCLRVNYIVREQISQTTMGKNTEEGVSFFRKSEKGSFRRWHLNKILKDC